MLYICALCDGPKRYEIRQHETKGWYVGVLCSCMHVTKASKYYKEKRDAYNTLRYLERR